jgi:hypothetical protein
MNKAILCVIWFVFLGNVLANYFFQFIGDKDWMVAHERTLFQFVTASTIFVGVILGFYTNNISQPKTQSSHKTKCRKHCQELE